MFRKDCHLKLRSILAAVFMVLLGGQIPARAGQIQYRDWTVGTIVMMIQAARYAEARLFDVGTMSETGIFQTERTILRA